MTPGVLGRVELGGCGSYSLWLMVGELELKLMAIDGHATPGAIVRLAVGAPPLV